MSKNITQNVKKSEYKLSLRGKYLFFYHNKINLAEFDPPNVIIGKNQSGLFQKETYKSGDVYQDPDQIRRKYENDKIKKRIHEEPFTTVGINKQLLGSAYEYQELNQGALNSRRFRNEQGIYLKIFKFKIIFFLLTGQVVIGHSNIKTGPVNMYFSKIEYKEDDFSRKELFRKTEYKQKQKKVYERGMFKNKITIEKPTFSANKEIFGSSEPDPIEVMKRDYLREQFLLNVQNKRRQLKPEELKKRRDIKDLDMYTYKIPNYIQMGFDTRIFDRCDQLKERFGVKSKQITQRPQTVKK